MKLIYKKKSHIECDFFVYFKKSSTFVVGMKKACKA